jgi:branched-chain amino acid transport system ATP-binding protein
MTRHTEIELHKLDVSYDGIAALRAVSLRTGNSGLVGIWGANMSGKSTLLRAIAGSVRADAGTIFLRADGNTFNIGRLSSEERLTRHRVFLCPEASGVFPSLTVEENLMLAPEILKLTGAKADLANTYARFPLLQQRRRVQARFLSGGWRQVLAISRAAMVHPRVLLCDEPFLGLSPPMARLVLDVIRGTVDPEGDSPLTIISEQRLERVKDACTSIHHLERGRVLD